MSPWFKLFDYFFVTRPILFFPGWATLLAGYLTAANSNRLLSDAFHGGLSAVLLQSEITLSMLAFALVMGGSFILNQLKDMTTDKYNRKLFFFGDGHIPPSHGYIESALLILAGFITGLMVNFNLFLVMVVFSVITGYLYNFYPFEIKNRPLAGLVANILMGWLAFAAGWVLLQNPGNGLLWLALPYIFFNTSLYFLTTLPDMKGDATSQKITFPLKYGFNLTIWLSFLCYLFAAAMSMYLGNEFMMVVLFLLSPFMVSLIVRKDIPSAIRSVKMGIFFFCIIVCFKIPLFFILMVSLFFFTKIFYKKRFDFNYPSFKGV